jgi:DNA-binding CsgD family transcriptional regulator/PAS domain-containing protein
MQFDHAISGLYTAAAGRQDWSLALTDVATALRLWVVQVLGVDKRDGRLMFSSYGGQATPQTSLDYFRYYSTIDPRIALGLQTPPDQWMRCHEHLDEAYVARSEFYQDFLIPHGGRWVSGTKLIDDERVQFILAFMRGQGSAPIGRDEWPLLASFKHHFTAAFANLLHLRDTQAELSMARELLGRFPSPMLLVDGVGRIAHANASASALLAQDERLSISGGYLACRHRPAQHALLQALHELQLSATPGAPPGQPRRHAVALCNGTGPRLLAFVSAMRPEAAMGAFGQLPFALVVLHDTANGAAPLDPLIVGECFGLTPAEAQVAVKVAAGHSVKDIARLGGVAVTTVRTHLASVLAKTGCSRQANLVGVLSALPVRT